MIINEIFFVSLGALLGANIRFQISNNFEKRLNLTKDISILIINTFASFGLGLFLSIMDQFRFIYSYQIVLFFSIGFLGSLSTFSSFVYDLFDLCLQLKFSRALKLFIISSSLGIIAFAFGFLLGNH